MSWISHGIIVRQMQRRTLTVGLRYGFTALLLVTLIGSSLTVRAQSTATQEHFSPSWRMIHYSPDEHPLRYQIWAIAEDVSGRIYIAEEDGIKVFNGARWVTVETGKGTTTRSLSSADGKRIYYGEQGDFGVITVTASGELKASSIMDSLGISVDVGDVWGTHQIGDRVFFQAREAVISVHGSEFSVHESENGFHNAFQVEGRYFVREFGVGLLEWQGTGFRKVKGSEALANKKVFMVTPRGGNSDDLIIWTQSAGQFILSSIDNSVSHLRTYPTGLARVRDDYRLYHGVKKSDNKYVIGTLGDGLVVVDSLGSVLNKLNIDTGFPDDFVNYVYKSENGNIWVGLNNDGVVYLDSFPALTRLGRDQGIKGHINSIRNYGQTIGVATGAGLFVLEGGEHEILPAHRSEMFKSYPGTSMAWDFHRSDSLLLAVMEDSLIYKNVSHSSPSGEATEWRSCVTTNAQNEWINVQGFRIQEYPGQEDYIVGLSSGVVTISIDNDPNPICRIKQLDYSLSTYDVRSLVIDDDGLWLGTRYDGLINVRRNNITQFKMETPSVSVVSIDGRATFFSESGIPYRFNRVDKNIEPDPLFSTELSSYDGEIHAIHQDGDKRIWLALDDRIVVGTKEDDRNYTFRAPEALKFARRSTSSLFVDNRGVLWFNDGDELVRYDESASKKAPETFRAGISSVTTIDKEPIFKGLFHDSEGRIRSDQPKSASPTLPFNKHSLIVSATAYQFPSPEYLVYKLLLEGRDNEWSSWQKDQEFVLSELHEGDYTVRIRARDILGRVSNEARYSFTIAPPWYRTWWAYLSYLSLGLVFGAMSIKSIRMRQAHRRAAEQAKELERERVVNKKLQEANQRLKDANKLKDEFLATTSHELRTPLTAILGFTSVLKEEIPHGADYREFLDIIEESGSRLMDTLNSLLDLAKLRAGIMEMNPETVNVYERAEEAAAAFYGRSDEKGLELKVIRPSKPVFAEVDVYALSRVLNNLISNAVKFTDSGVVKIVIERQSESAVIHVKDSGIGIEDKFIPRLFDEFIQESDGPARAYEGSGLGLAITGKFIRLMGGEISVKSEKGTGSVFIVRLPVRKSDANNRVRRRGNLAPAE